MIFLLGKKDWKRMTGKIQRFLVRECCSTVNFHDAQNFPELNQLYFQNGSSFNDRPVYFDSKNEYGIWFDAETNGKLVWKVGLMAGLKTRDAVFGEHIFRTG